jgi:lysophospholipase L1-like esterase
MPYKLAWIKGKTIMKTTMLRKICLAFVSFTALVSSAAAPFGENVIPRGSLDNARVKFSKGGHATVAFLGGSITEMNGYRPMVCNILQKRFPKTTFTFVKAGISSTCSTTGSFRLERDILSKGKIDMLFVEFAVNDHQDAHHTPENCIRGMEGIVRHARMANPEMDIVMSFFVNPFMLGELQQGNVPLTIRQHTKVAERYKVSTINLAKEVAMQIQNGDLTWKKYGGVHPAPFGNTIAASMIDELFNRLWKEPLKGNAKVSAHALPEPLDKLSYFNGRFVDINAADLKGGCMIKVPDWKKLKGGKRSRYTSCPTLCLEAPGAEFSLEFKGTAVGAFITAGPDAGVCEVVIDGGKPLEIDLYRGFSKGLHYPYTVMFANELKPGSHKLTLRMVDGASLERKALRIMHFCVN